MTVLQQQAQESFRESSEMVSHKRGRQAVAASRSIGCTTTRLGKMVAIALLLVNWGCQSVSTGLHDQLVRGSAVSPEEEREHGVGDSQWWTRWFPWIRRSEVNAATNMPVPSAVQPDDVTPATAWHVLQQLRAEVERDRQNRND